MSDKHTTSSVKLRIGLAPMEGVTEFATRLWYQIIGGMDFTWTPFLRVTDTFPAKLPEMFAPELTVLKDLFPAPLIFQVMGSRAENIVRTADVLGDMVEYIDLNCGCPSPTVVGSRAGSSLLERSEIFAGVIDFISKRVGSKRLSVKMRTGYHVAGEFPALVNVIKNQPLRHLTVHGRTRPDRYTGQADWGLIQYAAEQVVYPVIGSGDICDVSSSLVRVARAPDVTGAIIGRGALRNPWVFSKAESAPVVMAFAAFVLMQDLHFESPDLLIRWAANRSPQKFGNMNADDWWSEILGLSACRSRHPKSVYDIEVSSRALSRGKMLWNYLRSSLPDSFMEPLLMRSTKFPDLIQGIESIARRHQLSCANLPLVYRPELDWMFSGEGRGQKKVTVSDI